uniref:Uncharacterized protein n=1 Tax=Megaselia scalaris TaxID=36166 RepID=T1GG35_MEGSC
QIPNADISFIDDIVLSYIVSIIKEIEDDEFDLDAFQEMISAYFNDFATIDSGIVCAWLFKLEGELRQNAAVEEKEKDKKAEVQLASLKLSDIIPESKLKRRDSTAQEKEENATRNSRRSQHLSETSDAGSTDSSNYDYFIE